MNPTSSTQRNKNMFPFFLDDDMMDYVQPNKMFDIVVTDSPGPDADGKVDLQLVNSAIFLCSFP